MVRRSATAAEICRSTGPATAPFERWWVDADRSTLQVSVKVGPLVTVRGFFTDVSGNVDLSTDPIRSRVQVTVGTASLTSGSAWMDALLQGAGVVDCTRNPSMRFVSRAVRPSGRTGSWRLDGLLATAGAALDVTLEMTDPLCDNDALVFRASGTVQSKDAVRLLSQPGVERLLGRTMALDLTVTAVANGLSR